MTGLKVGTAAQPIVLLQEDAMVRLSEHEAKALIRYHATQIESILSCGLFSTKDQALKVQDITPKINQLSTVLYQMAVKQEQQAE